MKIKRIKFENHKILGNLVLDFTDETEKAVDTVILAGENGCGKTIVLESLYDLLIRRPGNLGISQVIFEASPTIVSKFGQRKSNTNLIYQETIHGNNTNIDFENLYLETETFFFLDKFTQKIIVTGNPGRSEILEELRGIYSTVEINFQTDNTPNVTSMNVDTEGHKSKKSEANLARTIKQLLIDLQSLDNNDYADSARINNGAADINKLDARIRRFKDAYSKMFPQKKLIGLKTEDNFKRVIFSENEKEIDIEHLSSGEKQIVFRGGFLLKDQKSHKGVFVLIDEPEISLHPKWQLKILDFYKNLFKDENGVQTSQIFVATHSPFIIHNENRHNDKVIILAKDENGKIFVKNDGEYFGWTPEKTVKEAFDIDFEKYANNSKPIVFVEGTTDIDYIKKAAEHLGKTGLLNQISFEDGGGESNLKNLWNGLVNTTSEIFKQKMLLLYDCDVNLNPSRNKNLLQNKIPQMERGYIKKGIENLFPDSLIKSAINFKKAFIDFDKHEKQSRGKLASENRFFINKDEKRNLCDWICQNAIKDDFKDFEKIFEIIEQTILN